MHDCICISFYFPLFFLKSLYPDSWLFLLLIPLMGIICCLGQLTPTGRTSLLAQFDCTENDNRTIAALGDAYTVILSLSGKTFLIFATILLLLFLMMNLTTVIKLLSEGPSVISDEVAVIFLFSSLTVKFSTGSFHTTHSAMSATHGLYVIYHFPALIYSAFCLFKHNLQPIKQWSHFIT